jgi:hypothetical protein
MARTYHRDRLGRFAAKGFSGQTGGQGARLMSPGRNRQGGGARIRRAAPVGTIGKPRNLAADSTAKTRLDAARVAARQGKPTASTKVGVADMAKAKRSAKSKDPNRKTVIETVNGRKIKVELQRAKPGGEYGPDGHFYPGGSWMSLGKFRGSAGAVASGVAGGNKAAGKGAGGGNDQQRVIRQRQPDPPPLAPIKGRGLPEPKGLKKRATALDQTFFDDRGFVRSDKALRDQGYAPNAVMGNDFAAALGNRLGTKGANALIARARARAVDKSDFDYVVFQETAGRNSMSRYDAERYRRSGVVGSRLTYMKGLQAASAMAYVSGDRAGRRPKDRRRRDSQSELTWTINGSIMTSRR